jgi:hypothetical protein
MLALSALASSILALFRGGNLFRKFTIRVVDSRTIRTASFMTNSLARTVCAAALLFTLGSSRIAAADPLIHSGDRVALIGGTLIESLQARGDCEASVIWNRPDLKVPFRNLGWSGDDASGSARRVFGAPEDGYARLMRDLEYANPTVAVIGYGFAEAANGLAGVTKFEKDLERLVVDLSARGIRLVLVKPFPMPGVRTDDYASAIERARQTIDAVASQHELAVIDPAHSIDAQATDAFDPSGLRLSDRGVAIFGRQIAAGLLGVESETLAPNESQRDQYEQLCQRVAEKNELFFHRHRPMNETYLFLFRKHEQGNNAVEVAQFEPLVQKAEAQLWQMAPQQ